MAFRKLDGETDYMSVEGTSDFDDPAQALYEVADWLGDNPSVVPISLNFFYDSFDDEWTAHLTVSGYEEDK